MANLEEAKAQFQKSWDAWKASSDDGCGRLCGCDLRDPRRGCLLRASAQLMDGNGLIVSFGKVMPMRLGWLQRQSGRAFRASAASEVSTSELGSRCWARQTLMEKHAPSRWQRESMILAGPHRFTGRRPRRPRKGGDPSAPECR